MKHPERVENYLGHIAEAIERATSYFSRYRTLTPSGTTRWFRMGVVRDIEIIGEAANHINRVAPEFIAQHPELPWPNMRNMRNIVIHAYFNVDLTTVWRTVQEDLPKLKQQIDQLRSQHPPTPPAQQPEPGRSR